MTPNRRQWFSNRIKWDYGSHNRRLCSEPDLSSDSFTLVSWLLDLGRRLLNPKMQHDNHNAFLIPLLCIICLCLLFAPPPSQPPWTVFENWTWLDYFPDTLPAVELFEQIPTYKRPFCQKAKRELPFWTHQPNHTWRPKYTQLYI